MLKEAYSARSTQLLNIEVVSSISKPLFVGVKPLERGF